MPPTPKPRHSSTAYIRLPLDYLPFPSTSSSSSSSHAATPTDYNLGPLQREDEQAAKERRRRWIWAVGGGTVLIVLVVWVCSGGERDPHQIPVAPQTLGANDAGKKQEWALGPGWKPGTSAEEGLCNPFAEEGYLDFNETDPLRSLWRPYTSVFEEGPPTFPSRKACTEPSSLFATLRDDLDRTIFNSRRSSTLRKHGANFPHTASGSSLSDFASDPSSLALPWLHNRTVVMLGDSIDRFHLRDFCDLISSSLQLTKPLHGVSPGGPDPSPSVPGTPSKSWHVAPDDPVSPALNLTRGSRSTGGGDAGTPEHGWPETEEDRRLWKEWWTTRWETGEEALLTRPWVCEVKEYGFMMVSVFTFGLEPDRGGRDFAHYPWYYPPSSAGARLQYILVPLLQSLATRFNRPQTVYPDLVEVASGLWDLRQFTEFDFAAAGSPLDEGSDIPYEVLSKDRLAWWRTRVEKLLEDVAAAFPGRPTGSGSLADPPTMLWRGLHHPNRHYYAPWSRVEELDRLARWMIAKLKREGGTHGREWTQRLQYDDSGAPSLLSFDSAS